MRLHPSMIPSAFLTAGLFVALATPQDVLARPIKMNLWKHPARILNSLGQAKVSRRGALIVPKGHRQRQLRARGQETYHSERVVKKAHPGQDTWTAWSAPVQVHPYGNHTAKTYPAVINHNTKYTWKRLRPGRGREAVPGLSDAVTTTRVRGRPGKLGAPYAVTNGYDVTAAGIEKVARVSWTAGKRPHRGSLGTMMKELGFYLRKGDRATVELREPNGKQPGAASMKIVLEHQGQTRSAVVGVRPAAQGRGAEITLPKGHQFDRQAVGIKDRIRANGVVGPHQVAYE